MFALSTSLNATDISHLKIFLFLAMDGVELSLGRVVSGDDPWIGI